MEIGDRIDSDHHPVVIGRRGERKVLRVGSPRSNLPVSS